ncbi:hypothetical protein MRX96_014730 [Rhipicephalus microplus]
MSCVILPPRLLPQGPLRFRSVDAQQTAFHRRPANKGGEHTLALCAKSVGRVSQLCIGWNCLPRAFVACHALQPRSVCQLWQSETESHYILPKGTTQRTDVQEWDAAYLEETSDGSVIRAFLELPSCLDGNMGGMRSGSH